MLTLNLKKESEAYVKEQLQRGAFASAEALVEASLNLFQQQQAKLAELRELMKPAQKAREEGRFTTYSTEEELDALTLELIEETRS
jgi:Arc/MetJ-type ribon-helix-helix transcriptional regulator